MATITPKDYADTASAINQRAYRDRLMASMTPEELAEHKAKLAARKKELRLKNKPPPVQKLSKSEDIQNHIMEILKEEAKAISNRIPRIPSVKSPEMKEVIKEKIHDLEKRMTNESIARDLYNVSRQNPDYKKISLDTIKRYLINLHRIQTIVIGKNLPYIDFESFRHPYNVIEVIHSFTTRNKKPFAHTTLVTLFNSLASILKYFSGFQEETKVYLEEMQNMFSKEMKEREENKPREKETVIEWTDVLEGYKKANFKNDIDRAIYAIYTLIPVRRVADYRLCYIERVENEDSLPEDKNYILLDTDGIPRKFIYNTFKTRTKYGKQTIDIPPELASVLGDYIENNSLGIGDILFPSRTKDVYTEGSFSRFIGDVFQRALGKRLTVNDLRHSLVTHFLKQPNLTVADKKAFATQLGHGMLSQALYNRI